ncbi:G-protein-signaling modulator 1 [Cynoglossus semilaevis]|uniref:G-protein-signaling modulator 1 n=1 Tax=Cynoglossus semilaevis TaxID=244447 RepID=UPI000497F948|nr:G-protein-signaling modulator 1-like [Cynoglossus semilaevis]XP_016898490.1 G-protein-signaling modulator 1-like [Cynoglossus semilaevis]
MADRKYSNGPSPSMSSPSHQNGQIGETVPQSSPLPHQNGVVDQFEGAQSSGTGSPVLQHLRSSSRTSDPPSHFRALGDFVTSVREAAFPRPRGQSLGSSLSSRMRTAARARRRGSQQEEPEALLDLILESQGQRLNDQRASLSLLPDPGAAALCETCNLNQPHAPTMDFYYMLIDYQSDRMEDQRCSLPDLEDVAGLLPDAQEDFFSLIHRVQSRRMDEQRASVLMSPTEDNNDNHSSISSGRHHHHHH